MLSKGSLLYLNQNQGRELQRDASDHADVTHRDPRRAQQHLRRDGWVAQLRPGRRRGKPFAALLAAHAPRQAAHGAMVIDSAATAATIAVAAATTEAVTVVAEGAEASVRSDDI